jgi:16S rRNA (cytosine967-C5)-methyltransferase
MAISPARLAAFWVLEQIHSQNAMSSALLDEAEADLSPADRSLCHELALGVLRRQIHLDRLISALANKEPEDAAVRIALRLGLYQLTFLDRIPPHAAINDSVELVVKARKRSAKGFVNALLRRAARERIDLTFSDELDRVSVETSHPRWLLEKWIAQFGLSETEQLAQANNRPIRLAFRRTAKGAHLHLVAEESSIVRGCLFASEMTAELRAMQGRGEIYFQDEGSQLVAAAVEVPAEGRFLDVCAAPGGKSGAVFARNGAVAKLFVAGEFSGRRADLLNNTCEKQGVAAINVLRHDAEKVLPFREAAFDSVLVDAPCSGTGTIRSNPEIRYRLRPADLPAFHKRQLEILTNASKTVAYGGQLIYSTCSLEREENEQVCSRFLEREKAFSVAASEAVPPRFKTAEGFYRTFPHRDGMDGFFIANFRRLHG